MEDKYKCSSDRTSGTEGKLVSEARVGGGKRKLDIQNHGSLL